MIDSIRAVGEFRLLEVCKAGESERHRYTLAPDADVSGEPTEVQDAAAREWTQAVKDAYAAWKAERDAIPAATVRDVKTEAARRILAYLPEYKQRNITARGVELLRIGELNWTAEQKAEADAIQAQWDHIKAIRAASDKIEAMSPIPADYDADARWP